MGTLSQYWVVSWSKPEMGPKLTALKNPIFWGYALHEVPSWKWFYFVKEGPLSRYWVVSWSKPEMGPKLTNFFFFLYKHWHACQRATHRCFSGDMQYFFEKKNEILFFPPRCIRICWKFCVSFIKILVLEAYWKKHSDYPKLQKHIYIYMWHSV